MTPADAMGGFVMFGHFAGSSGAKSYVVLMLRHGLGVEKSMSMGSSVMSEIASGMLLADFQQMLLGGLGPGGQESTMMGFSAAARITNQVALAMLDRAEAEKRTSHHDAPATQAFRQGLETASVEPADYEAVLATWHRDAVTSDRAILKMVQSFSGMPTMPGPGQALNDPLTFYLIDLLEKLEKRRKKRDQERKDAIYNTGPFTNQ